MLCRRLQTLPGMQWLFRLGRVCRLFLSEAYSSFPNKLRFRFFPSYTVGRWIQYHAAPAGGIVTLRKIRAPCGHTASRVPALPLSCFAYTPPPSAGLFQSRDCRKRVRYCIPALMHLAPGTCLISIHWLFIGFLVFIDVPKLIFRNKFCRSRSFSGVSISSPA